jgi:acyl carrier protein
VPIGRPLPNTEAYVLDRQLQPVPIGVAGELHIGGSCLARGYLGRPEVSAESFIPNPFGDQVGARLYRTGDVVRYRADGSIELLGRTDQQVKIRGFRVEPAEVATVLGAHPAVRNSLVVARDDRRGDRQLVAYVVRREGREASAAELRHFLGSKLPDYMVPSHFVGLDALPLTPHGKVDWSALPDPGTARPEMDSPFVPASSPVEVELAGIWAAVLEVERVGIHDNFFDLGGHSLSAFRLVSRVVQAFQLDLSLKALFDAPTVAEMARVIQAIGAKPATARVVQRMQGALDATSDERGQKGSAGLD